MGYFYEDEKPRLFTEEGVETLFEVWEKFYKHLKHSGAFVSSRVFATGDVWLSMAALDYLSIERREIKCINPSAAGQDLVYVKGKRFKEEV